MSAGDTDHDFFFVLWFHWHEWDASRVLSISFLFQFPHCKKAPPLTFPRRETETSKSNQLAAKVKMSLLTLAAICFEISARWLALGPGGHFDWRYIWLALWQVVLVAVNQTIWQCFYLFSLFLFSPFRPCQGWAECR